MAKRKNKQSVWRSQSGKGRYESAMWRAAGLEEQAAPAPGGRASGDCGGAGEEADVEVDNYAAGGFFGLFGRDEHEV